MNVIFDNVWILSENHLKAFRMFPTLITTCKNCANFLPCFVQFDWLISDQLRYLLNIYQFDCSVLSFLTKNSSNKSTKSTSCFFFFLFNTSKITKLMNKNLKKAMVGISWEIWCFNQETGRFDEKFGDSWENGKSWHV